MRQEKAKKGFTLIELLVVIAIIGVLSTLAVVALNSARQKSRDAKRVADVKQMQTALELYYSDTNSYPVQTDIVLGDAAGDDCGTLEPCTKLCDTGFQDDACGAVTYMGLVPAAPAPFDGDCDAAENAYTYTGTATSYTIEFCIGGPVGALVAGNLIASEAGIQ